MRLDKGREKEFRVLTLADRDPREGETLLEYKHRLALAWDCVYTVAKFHENNKKYVSDLIFFHTLCTCHLIAIVPPYHTRNPGATRSPAHTRCRHCAYRKCVQLLRSAFSSLDYFLKKRR
jgi:hypothetical protein